MNCFPHPNDDSILPYLPKLPMPCGLRCRKALGQTRGNGLFILVVKNIEYGMSDQFLYPVS